ncbi:PAS-domain containing protein [Aestuariibius sp. 2305UL40-4]|uniref:PAS-domain containing protein n=1 Tax=Aestuariibius violaceus TaxID=3234132 RepID=UPI00345E244B
MLDLTPLTIGLTIAGASFFSLCLVIAVLVIDKRRMPRIGTIKRPPPDAIVLLFDGDALADATPQARALLGPPRAGRSDLDRFLEAMAGHFPGLRDALSDLDTSNRVRVDCTDRALSSGILAENCRGTLRIEVLPESHTATDMSLQHATAQKEVEILRGIAEDAPQLIWKEDKRGNITWANASYLDIADRLDGHLGAWPPPRLFKALSAIGTASAVSRKRLSVDLPDGGDPLWFDVVALDRGSEVLFVAEDAGPLVKAETAQQNFIQTLSKTFAHLPTGLAVFDRNRRLVLFNPALHDLTGLPVSFLATRPSLHGFLDRLREARVLPEPKDYKSWREAVTSMEHAASSGTYEENWTLPEGQTYKVTGRPHPDGAVAFLIEDISADISLTRRFRSQIDMGQSVIDAQRDAIAVFSPTGVMTLSNSAFAELWDIADSETVAEVTAIEATRDMQIRCLPTPAWGDLRDFVGTFGERSEWTAPIHLKDGRIFELRCSPIAGGATLCTFERLGIEGTALPHAPSLDTVAAHA